MVVVYKIDRLTRSLFDFAKIVEAFDARDVSFVSITQQFNTTTSMGRLTLNVLLSFAQFEREVAGERIRDKIAASKKKGHVDGRLAVAWLRRAEPKVGRQRGGSWHGRPYLPAICRAPIRARAAGRTDVADGASRQPISRPSSSQNFEAFSPMREQFSTRSAKNTLMELSRAG